MNLHGRIDGFEVHVADELGQVDFARQFEKAAFASWVEQAKSLNRPAKLIEGLSTALISVVVIVHLGLLIQRFSLWIYPRNHTVSSQAVFNCSRTRASDKETSMSCLSYLESGESNGSHLNDNESSVKASFCATSLFKFGLKGLN